VLQILGGLTICDDRASLPCTLAIHTAWRPLHRPVETAQTQSQLETVKSIGYCINFNFNIEYIKFTSKKRIMEFTDIGKMDTSILTYITILIYYMTLQCKIIMNIFEKSETRHTKRKSDGKTNQ